jgi:hypothetical protein
MRYGIRVLIILAALLVMFITPLFVVSSVTGTTIEPAGVLIDAVALAAILGSVLTWRKRPAAS